MPARPLSCGSSSRSASGGVAPEHALYLSFDDDRLADIAADQLGALLEAFYRRHPQLRRRATVSWFLDEIQLVAGWERLVRRARADCNCASGVTPVWVA